MSTKQVEEEKDKLKALENIFGKDLTTSVIGTVLRSHDNKFDDTVDTLLSMSNNAPNARSNTFNANVGPEEKEKENIKSLQNMFGDLTQSVIATVYESNKGDVGETVDTLLNITSKELASGGFKERREIEVARQEAEVRRLEEFNRLQTSMQEEAKRLAEAAQKEALLRTQEEERLRNEERARKEEERKQIMLEQEKLFKAYEQKRSAEEGAKALSEAQERKKREDELKRSEELKQEMFNKMETVRRQLDEERIKIEAEKRALEMRRIKETEERALREQEERRRQEEVELRIREEEKIKRAWEERLRQIEEERRREEQARREEQMKLQLKMKEEALRREEEERIRVEEERLHHEEERLRLEVERIKLESMRKKVEEDKKNAEEKIKLLEIEAKKRDEEEQEKRRVLEEQEKQREEEERQRHEEEQAKIAKQQLLVEEERKKKQAEDHQLSASVIVITPPQSPEPGTNNDNAAKEVPKCVITTTVIGDVVSGTWTLPNDASATPTDWLALFPVTQPAANKYTQYIYTGGSATGQFTFKGVNPGQYDIRFFPNKTYEYIARTSSIRVGPAAALTAQLAGDQLKVQYTFFPTSQAPTRDWVGVYEKSQRRNKKYITSAYGNSSGEVTIKAPRQPGTYEARVFAAGSYYNDQARVEFTVEDHDSISVAPEVVQAGAQLSAVWTMLTVESSTSDWVGMFKTDETNNSKYIASAYTQGASVGSVLMPVPKEVPAGMYELRLFSKAVGKYVTFQTSAAFTVTN